jgi:hypothetical protein
MVDPECPWWAKLRRAESLIDEIRHASRRSQSREWLGDCSGDAEEAVVNRIRLIEPISADFAVLLGDAIGNLRSSLDQVAYQLARAALWSAHRGCRANDGVNDPHLRSLTIGRVGRTNRPSCAARRSSGSGVPDDSLGTAVRVRRAAEGISGRSREDAVGRSREAERDNDVGFVLNRLRNVCKHRRLPLLAATLAP